MAAKNSPLYLVPGISPCVSSGFYYRGFGLRSGDAIRCRLYRLEIPVYVGFQKMSWPDILTGPVGISMRQTVRWIYLIPGIFEYHAPKSSYNTFPTPLCLLSWL